jgi:hypothetical protein
MPRNACSSGDIAPDDMTGYLFNLVSGGQQAFLLFLVTIEIRRANMLASFQAICSEIESRTFSMRLRSKWKVRLTWASLL